MTITADRGAHAAPAKKRSKKKIVVVSAIAATLVAPAAAWAAVQLFGFGQIDAAAATTQNLTVDNTTAKLTAKLLPGTTVGSEAIVANPNDFPVTVTAVIVRNSTLAVVPPSAACQNSVHVIGSATTWPGQGGGAGTLQAIEEFVTIPAQGQRKVTVPNAVRQDESAEVLCGVKAEFAVKAQNAS